MTREEAIEAVKAKMDYYENDKRLRTAMETLISELCESEDERIRKWLSDILDASCWRNDWPYTKQQVINYLEKQKELPTDEEMLRTLRAEYEKGVADTIAKYEQKERKSLNIIAASEWLRKHVCNYMNSEYNEFHKCVEYDGSIDKERLINDFEEAMQKEQKPIHPNIEREYIEKRLRGLIDKEGEYYRGAREELAHLFYILGGQPSQYLINNIATEEQTPKSVEAEALKINKNIWHVCTRDVFIDGKPVYLKGDIVNSDDFMLVLDTPTAKAAFHRVWFPNNDEEKFCNAVLHRNPDKQ